MFKRTRKLFYCLLILALAPTWAVQAAEKNTEITISAAASLTNAFGDIKTAFEHDNPGIKIITNFAASNPLLAQIEKGAPVDVFASADQETMDKAAGKGLLAGGSRSDFAANSLVLIVPANDKTGLSTSKELAGKNIERIAIGNPDSVPAGRYAREALQTAQSWEALRPKCIQAENVRQVLDYVARGEVQAGFVYKTDALQAGEKIRIIETMPLKTPVLYPIAIINNSGHKAEAEAFLLFVKSPKGQGILSKYGFSQP